MAAVLSEGSSTRCHETKSLDAHRQSWEELNDILTACACQQGASGSTFGLSSQY